MKPPLPHQVETDHDAPPFNPLPWSVTLLAVVIFGIELVFTAAGAGLIGGPEATGWRLAALERFGFLEPLMGWMIENHVLRWDYVSRLLTYPFFHGTFTHAMFVTVFVLALGKLVGEVLAGWSVLLIFMGASVAGALAYWLAWDTAVVLFGGYPGAYGLVGAFTFILWAGLAGNATGLQAFTLIAFLAGIQLVFALIVGGGYDWVADIAGFGAGFGLAFLVSPGGWAAVKRRVRRQ